MSPIIGLEAMRAEVERLRAEHITDFRRLTDADADLERARADLAAAHAEIEELAGQLDDADAEVRAEQHERHRLAAESSKAMQDALAEIARLKAENADLRRGRHVPSEPQEGTSEAATAVPGPESWADRQIEPGER